MKKKIALVLSLTTAFGLFLCSCGKTDKACEHDWNAGKSTATCEQAGEITYTCSKCNEQKVEQAAALGHDFPSEWTIDVPAACETAGSKSYHCTRCDQKSSVTEVAPLGHQFSDEWTTDTAATCTEVGSKSHHCTVCGAKKDETSIPLSAHDLKVETVAATCIAAGKITTTCKHCDYKVEENIPALGHSWDIASPTCTQGQVCTTCQAKGAQALGHQYHETTVAATCTTDGYKLHECGTCDYSYKDSIVAATGHEVNRWIEDLSKSSVDENDPCLHHIAYNGQCLACQTSVTKTEDVERHTYSATITKSATCTVSGEKTYTCSVCEDSYKEGYDDADAHSWDAGVEASGVTTYTCTLDHSHTKTAISLKDLTTANLSKDILNADTAVELKEATINLDATALETLGNDFSLTAETLADEDKNNLQLSDEQKSQIGDNKIYNFGMNDGGANFGEGKVTISVPYTLGEGEDPDCIAVWYIDETGNVHTLEAKYSNGFATFDTNHFSYYTVTRLTPAQRCELYGHSNKETVVPATCISGGYTRVICVRCGAVEFKDQTPVLGHHVVKLDSSVEATCTTDGLIKYACDRDGCGFHYEIVIGSLGHDYEEQTENKVAATCQKSGHTSYACSRCDSTYETTLPQLKHQMQDEVVSPTCTESGYTKHTCAACGTSFVDSIRNATGHHFMDEIVEATCTTDGYTNHHCTACDESEKINVVPAHHTWNIETPTCGQGQTCVICSTAGLPATGQHTMVNGVCSICGNGCQHTNVEELVAATCEEKGYTKVTCSKCNTVSYKDYVNALGHEGSFECSRCHKLLVNEAYFKNLVNSLTSTDLTLVVKDVKVTIPNQVDMTISFGEISLQLDDKGNLIGYGSGTVNQDIGNYGSLNGTVQAVIQDNTFYVITTTNQFYTKPTYDYYSIYQEETHHFMNSQNYVSYERYTLSDIFGTDEATISAYVEMYQQILTDIQTIVVPMAHNIFTANETSLVNALKRCLQKLFELKKEGSSYAMTFNFEALKDINDLLYTTPVNEVVDALFGEKTFAAVKTLLPTTLGKTVKEVLGYIEAFGINLNQLVPLVESYLNLISNGEMKTLADVFSAYTGADLKGKTILEFLNSEDISKLKISEFIATYFGITDTTEAQMMITEYMTSLENVTIYAFVGGMLDVTEEELAQYKELANGMVDEYSSYVTITLKTDSVGNIQSALIDLDEFSTDFFSCNGTVEFYPYINLTNQYDSVVTKVNSYFNQFELSEDNIDGLCEALGDRAYGEHTIACEKDEDGNYIITVTTVNENEMNQYSENEFTIKEIEVTVHKTVYTTKSFEVEQVTSDCGNWVTINYALSCVEIDQYSIRREIYVDNALVESITDKDRIQSYEYTRTIWSFLCYNLKTKQIVGVDTMHQYMPYEANSVEATGCNGVGKLVYSCKDCGDIMIAYYVNGHKNVEQSFEFKTEDHDCEKGVIITTHCNDCNTDVNVREVYSHETLKRFVDLKEYGYYGEGGLYIETCPCEKINWAEMAVDVLHKEWKGSYTDELGLHEEVSIFVCENEGGEYFYYQFEILYQQVEGCLYNIYRRFLVGYNPETEVYEHEFLILQTQREIHQNVFHTVTLVEGSKTCEDGVQVVTTCLDCKAEIYNKVEYDHIPGTTKLDLKDYGSTCGGVAIIEQCACGKNGYIDINARCGLDSQHLGSYIDEENGYRHEDVQLYQCAVTDPSPCQWAYVREILFVPIEGCNFDVYERFLLGYKPEDKSFVKEIKISRGTEQIHERESSQEELVDGQGHKGVRETVSCKKCGNVVEIREEYALLGENLPYYETYVKYNEEERFYTYDFTNECIATVEYRRNGEIVHTEQQNVCRYDVHLVAEPSCSQSGLEQFECIGCHTVRERMEREPYGHNFYHDPDLGIYVCGRCGMQSSTGVDGRLVIEELSEEGSSEVRLGYWNRENIDFILTVTMINKETLEPSETIVDFSNFIREESLVIFNMDECKVAATQAGFDLSLYDIRINFVPVGSSDFDYGITFGNLA